MNPINCSVTVMLVKEDKIGFIRRAKEDTFGGLLVAPGGKIEETDYDEIEKTAYWCAEKAAVREIKEEVGIELSPSKLHYFCSLRLPNNRVVLSFYTHVFEENNKIEYYNTAEIKARDDFAPGMKTEALLLLEKINADRKRIEEIMGGHHENS